MKGQMNGFNSYEEHKTQGAQQQQDAEGILSVPGTQHTVHFCGLECRELQVQKSATTPRFLTRD